MVPTRSNTTLILTLTLDISTLLYYTNHTRTANTGGKMKAGMVTQIRVNPRDCQSILDLMGLLNVDPYDGRSFAQCVALALSSLLDSYRQGGSLPEVDTFQYLNRMGPFLNSRNNKTKSAMAASLYRRNGNAIPILRGIPQQEVPHPGQYIPEALQGWTENGPVTTANVPMLLDEGTKELIEESFRTMDVETLVEEFHKIKGIKNKSPVESFRLKQIDAELQRRNSEGDSLAT